MQSELLPPDTPFLAARVATQAEQAYRLLEGMFVNGVIVPGTFVSEPELQRLTGLGRTPLRESIKQMEAERLLMPVHRKGIFVPPISVRQQLFGLELRRPIESFVYATAAQRATGAQRQALRRVAAAFKAPVEENNAATLDYEFKRLAIQATQNPFAASALRPLHTMSRRFWYFHIKRNAKDQVRSHRFQERICRAVAAADPGEAERTSLDFNDFLKAVARRVLAMEQENEVNLDLIPAHAGTES